MKWKHLYLILAVLGICYTWYFNILWFKSVENPTLIQFFKDAQLNFASKSISADLSIVVITFFVFYGYESLRLKIKYWWVLIPLTFLVAIAFTFPLFLYMREITIEKQLDEI